MLLCSFDFNWPFKVSRLVHICDHHFGCSFPRTRRNTLLWRHNKRDGVPNHRCIDCLLNRFFMRRSNKISKLRVTGLCEENSNSPVIGELPAQRASNAENVSVWWRHHGMSKHHSASLPAWRYCSDRYQMAVNYVSGIQIKSSKCNQHGSFPRLHDDSVFHLGLWFRVSLIIKLSELGYIIMLG